MDDPRWLRVITVGLVLAALAVGYYLLSGAFSLNKIPKPQAQVNKIIPTPVSSPTPVPSTSPSQNAYSRIIARNQAEVQTLPRTGFPVGVTVILSGSAMIVGLGLRKFPD